MSVSEGRVRSGWTVVLVDRFLVVRRGGAVAGRGAVMRGRRAAHGSAPGTFGGGKGAVEEGWWESAEGSRRVCEGSPDLVLVLPQRGQEVGQGAGEGDVAVRATYPGLGGGGEARRGGGRRRRREGKSSRLQCLTSFSIFAFCVWTR